MLSHDWKELEFVAQRLERLRGQYRTASRDGSTNPGEIEGLRRDIVATQRQHEQLLAHISTQLVASFAA